LSDRRAFLAGGTAALASAFTHPPAARARSTSRLIDVHHHMIPPPYLKYNRRAIISGADVDPTPVLSWSASSMIEAMDLNGIAVAMLSMSSPGISMLGGTRDQVRKLARACNEYAASLRRTHPGRLGHFAAVPMPDVAGALTETTYALDVLKSDGIELYTNYRGNYLGEPSFKPLFAELNRRKAVVFVHPTQPRCCTELPQIEPSVLEFYFDTTRAIASLLYNGTLAANPDIRFIFAQAGGALPALAQRMIAWGETHHPFGNVNIHGVSHELQKLYFDTASSANDRAIASIMTVTSSSQIVFGSDSPYVSDSSAAAGMEALHVSGDVRAAIERGNAQRLFPRLSVQPRASSPF
jgi:predicted TIM-barrel fold metal-dependent hydrolase